MTSYNLNSGPNKYKSSVTSTPDTPTENVTPCVRYGMPDDDDGLEQTRLVSIGEEPPEGAIYRSPGIYFLTSGQLDALSNGRPSKSIQRECENRGQVYYNVVAESDGLEPNSGHDATEIIDWLKKFAEDWLGITEYSLAFSGNRSIHLHSTAYVTHSDWVKLRDLVKQFNDEENADLDPSIYKPKGMFRMMGVQHRQTGCYKIPIAGTETRESCIQKSLSVPSLENIDSLTHYWARVEGREPELPEIRVRVIDVLIKASSKSEPRFDNPPVSPYKNVQTSGDRSLIFFRQEGEIFERDGTRYVPCFIIEAAGGDGDGGKDGDGFVRHNSFTPVKLSPIDAEKWEFVPGDHGMIIGRGNGQSILHDLGEDDAHAFSLMLRDEGKSETLTFLDRLGYDIGSDGVIEGNYETSCGESGGAAEIQRGIEDGTEPLTYDNCFRVACRLLKIHDDEVAYKRTQQWFKEVMGPRYDREKTHEYLEPALDSYFPEVEIPE